MCSASVMALCLLVGSARISAQNTRLHEDMLNHGYSGHVDAMHALGKIQDAQVHLSSHRRYRSSSACVVWYKSYR